MTEPSAPKPVRLLALALGLGSGLLVLLVFVLVRPVEWGEAKLRFRLWRAGARVVLREKHRGFTQDRCGGRPPAECECMWFLHGMGDSVVTWRNFFLEPEAFAGRPVRVFALDLPGHGGSIRRHDLAEYRASNMARELDAEVARTPECVRNTLVGNSFGGWVAARMALESPARYAHLVLISPAGLRASESESKDLLREPTVESLKEFQRRAYFRPRSLSDSEWRAAVERVRASDTGEIRGAQVPADDLDASLEKIAVDTWLIRGDADGIISRATMEVYATKIPKAKFFSIADCGHLPQKECPDRLFSLIQRVLAVSHSAP